MSNSQGINWDAVSAIGTCIGAMATFAAVVVALWQTKWSNRKRLKLSVQEGIHIIDNKSLRTVTLRITNIGNKRVIIDHFSFYIKKKESQFMPFSIIQNGIEEMFTPKTIEVDECLYLSVPLERFIDYLQKQEHVNKYFMPSAKITFCVTEKTGREYTVLSGGTIKDYLPAYSNNSSNKQ